MELKSTSFEIFVFHIYIEMFVESLWPFKPMIKMFLPNSQAIFRGKLFVDVELIVSLKAGGRSTDY